MPQLSHGQVSEVGGLNDGLRGRDFSAGALVKGKCLMIVVNKFKRYATFSVHLHAFIESFSCPIVSQSSDGPATSVIRYDPAFIARVPNGARCYYLDVIGVARYAVDNPIWE